MDCFATEYYAASKFLYSPPPSLDEILYFEFCTKENAYLRPEEFKKLDPQLRTDVDAFLFDVRKECQEFVLIPKYIRRYLKVGGLVILFTGLGVPFTIVTALTYIGIVFLLLAANFFIISIFISKSIKRQLLLYKGKIQNVIREKYGIRSKNCYFWKLPDLTKATISWLELHLSSQKSFLCEESQAFNETNINMVFVPDFLEEDLNYSIRKGN